MAKRKEDPLTRDDHDKLEVVPLGAGNEVGRSCIYLSFKGKNVLLDCGIHPGRQGIASLPFFDTIDPSSIDVLLITHFHLDHAASLPYFLFKTSFRGRVFMTHATKAVYRLLLADFIKVTRAATEGPLFSEQEISQSMDRIEVIDFHQVQEVNGIRFWCYTAGHVLGAAMFTIDIAGVRVLYTGDYSREEDRHLKAAEVPDFSPDLCIIESTFGVQLHEPRQERERRFVDLVTSTVLGGGRLLIPAFALGRAQELLLILDEHWQRHPELQHIPIFYASPLARKAMLVYRTYTGSMNDRMRDQCEVSNPFDFKFIQSLRGFSEFEDKGPAVVMATPGSLQSGFSRQLFDQWCQDYRNVCLLPGYVVDGTLAKTLLSEPKDVTTLTGAVVPLRMQIQHISFAAHADFAQTSSFLEALQPANVVLVHGEATEMGRLRGKLTEQFRDRGTPVQAPQNCQTVDFFFKGEKMVKAVGKLAHWRPGGTTEGGGEDAGPAASVSSANGSVDAAAAEGSIAGVLVRKEFSFQLIAPEELSSHTAIAAAAIVQRQSVPYSGPFHAVRAHLSRMFDRVTPVAGEPVPTISIGGRVTVAAQSPERLVLQWASDPLNDMLADCLLAALLQMELPRPATATGHGPSLGNGVQADGNPSEEEAAAVEAEELGLVKELLEGMFGDVRLISEKGVAVRVDGAEAVVSLPDGAVVAKDENLRSQVGAAVARLLSTIRPVALT